MNEREAEFARAIGKVWEYLRSDGSFTQREITEFVYQMDSSLCREVLCSVISTAWSEIGGKNQGK